MRNRFGGDETELLGLGGIARDDARKIFRLVNVAEISAEVFRILALYPQTAAVEELDVGILLGYRADVRVEVAIRSREDQLGVVVLDHALHGLLHIDGLRNLFHFQDFDAGHLLDRGGALSVGLVVAVVVFGPHVNKADGQRLGAGRGGAAGPAFGGATRQTECQQRERGCGNEGLEMRL